MTRLCAVLICSFTALVSSILCLGMASSLQAQNDMRTRLDDAVLEAFGQAADGWSSDEVLLNDNLNRAFLEACHRRLDGVPAADLNWRLLTLRKQGKLNVRSTKRRHDDYRAYSAAAEIVARRMEDRHGVGTDRVMCDPSLRRDFDLEGQATVPHVDSYLLRKAAFGLRKARRLRPELVSRVADFDRHVSVYSLEELKSSLNLAPTAPGVYIFSEGQGYLYIGESQSLRDRLGQHLDEADGAALINLLAKNNIALDRVRIELHAFDPRSRAREVRVRRAYESQLIDSRQPRFNIRP